MALTHVFVKFLALIFVLAVILYTLGLALSSTDEQENETSPNGSRVSDTLKFVVVISRHGNRGPLFDLPNSPYPVNDAKYWPYGLQQLTTVGRDQMYNLGMKIRSLYNGFLNPLYYTEDFYASSTAVDRALISGEAFLAGLYPPTGFQLWNNKILWQPTPLYSNSPDKSQGLNGCPRYVRESQVAASNFTADNHANLTAVLSYINGITGANLTSALGLFISWDTLTTEEDEGYVLPEWTKKVFPEPMNDLAGKLFYEYFASTDTICRIIMGPFMDEMLGLMSAKVNGTLTPDRKMYFYSGHDITLVTLQAILGIPKSSIITPVTSGSGMMFELHQDPKTEKFFVEVLYVDGNSPNLEPTTLDIPGCSYSCSFDQLVNSTLRFTHVNYDEECQINNTGGHITQYNCI